MEYGKYRFNRLEFSGSLGDLGTLLPLAIGQIVINGLDPTGVLFMIGLFYILSGVYYGVTVPVQPMKVIGAYVIAMGMTQTQILSAALGMGLLMLFLGVTGLMEPIGKYTPRSVVRGVQLSVGVVLMIRGIEFMIKPDPHLALQTIGPVSTGILLGVAGAIITFLLLENKRIPAAVVVVAGGMLIGLLIGKPIEEGAIKLGLHFPRVLQFGVPSRADILVAIPLLVIPQLPMTIGNAVISVSDLTKEYFGGRSRMTSLRALANSQGLANLGSFLFGGIPMCHGAGGLAAHYRFGARTAGSNLMIGGIFLILAILFGSSALRILYLLPLSVLGVLLVFAGGQLALMIFDVKEKQDLFVVLLMLGIAIATNLAVAFIAGILIAYAFKYGKLKI